VAVEQDARALAVPAGPFGDNDRMPFGCAHAGVEADAGEIARDELRGRAAFVLVGRIGRDRLDLEEREQAIEALVELGIDTIEDGRKHVGR
jgi:hypothetical protein